MQYPCETAQNLEVVSEKAPQLLRFYYPRMNFDMKKHREMPRRGQISEISDFPDYPFKVQMDAAMQENDAGVGAVPGNSLYCVKPHRR